MKNQPLVTVYIPTFNRVELLKRAVKSVQYQTYQNLEIIIVDDCSTDKTHEYLEKLGNEDKRVRYFIKEKNSGACVSRNIAIENANGEFITGLDDDDYFNEQRIQKFIDEWCDEYSGFFSINVFKKNDKKFKANKKSIPDMVLQKDLLKKNFIGNQIFTKTYYLKKIGGFDPNMKVWQDLECWYRLLEIGPAKKINHELQVVDISHPHERISKKNPNKIIESYLYFSKKHSLTEGEILDLETHLISYKGLNLNLIVFIRHFNNVKNFSNFIKIFVAVIKRARSLFC